MNKELKDFIYGISEFNDCTFCKRFGFAKKCPLKNAYKFLDDEPSAEVIEQNGNLCRNFVFTSVESLVIEKKIEPSNDGSNVTSDCSALAS